MRQEAAQWSHLESGDEVVQMATVVAYVKLPEQGAELTFAHSQETREACAHLALGECCQRSDLLRLQPLEGDAVLFFNFRVNGSLDANTEHRICPMEGGELWIAEWGFFSLTGPPNIPEKAKPSDQPVIVFFNMEEEEFDIFWAPDGGGEEKLMNELPAGPYTQKDMNTFVGHAFSVRSKNGTLVARVVASSKSRQRREVSWSGPIEDAPEKGKPGKQPVVVFVNMEAEPFKINWVPPGGGEEVYVEELVAGPGSWRELKTFEGHILHVRSQSGKLVTRVTATSEPEQRVEVSDSGLYYSESVDDASEDSHPAKDPDQHAREEF